MKREYVTPEISITNFDICDKTNYVSIRANYCFSGKKKYSTVNLLNS